MRRHKDIDMLVTTGRPAKGGLRDPSRIDEKEDFAQPNAPASPSPVGNEEAFIHRSDVGDGGELEKYLVHIAHLDLALSVKIELISSLRDIMQSFIDRAFGEDPTQLCLDDRNRNKTDTDFPSNVVVSTDNAPNHSDKNLQLAARPLEDKPTRS